MSDDAKKIAAWMRKTFTYRIRTEVYEAIERGDWRTPDDAAQPPEPEPCDLSEIQLPPTTREFAQWLRDVAAQVDRISDRPLLLNENDVEVGFYYGNPMFPQKPTGLHFAVNFASTEYSQPKRRTR